MARRRRTYRDWVRLFPLVVAAHDLEELLTMPSFARGSHARLMMRPDLYEARTLGIAMTQIQVMITGVALAELRHGSPRARACATALSGAFFLNGVMHVGLSAALRRYTPGVATAVLVLMPATGATLAAVRRERLLTDGQLARRVLAGLGVTGPLIAFHLLTSRRLAEIGRTKGQTK